MTPKFELGQDFCTVHLPPSFIILCLLVQTNKQTPLKTSNALRYATTLRKNAVMWNVLTELRRQTSKHGAAPEAPGSQGELYESIETPDTSSSYQQLEMSRRWLHTGTHRMWPSPAMRRLHRTISWRRFSLLTLSPPIPLIFTLCHTGLTHHF